MSSNLSYEYERDDYYCYPGSVVLKNKLNLLSEKELSAAEREITGLKSLEFLSNPYSDKLDFNYIKSYIDIYFLIFMNGLVKYVKLILVKEIFSVSMN